MVMMLSWIPVRVAMLVMCMTSLMTAVTSTPATDPTMHEDITTCSAVDAGENKVDCLPANTESCGAAVSVNPDSGKIAKGHGLLVTCQMKNTMTNTTDVSPFSTSLSLRLSTLVLVKPDGSSVVGERHLQAANSSHIQAYIPHVTEQDEGLYKCVLRHHNSSGCTTVGYSALVKVGDPPPVISTVTVKSLYFQSLDVSWCSSDLDEHIHWALDWIVEDGTHDQCRVTNGSSCTCHICGSYPHLELSHPACESRDLDQDNQFMKRANYNFTITGTNDYGRSVSNVLITAGFDAVQTHSVSSVSVITASAHSLTLQWCAPEELTSNQPAVYNISLANRDGCQPDRQITYPVTGGALDVSTCSRRLLYTYTVDQLHPHSVYDISIQVKPEPGQYWSKPVKLVHQTKPAAPLKSPDLIKGGFWEVNRHTCTQDPQSRCRTVEFYWDPLSLCEMQGALEDIYLTFSATPATAISHHPQHRSHTSPVVSAASSHSSHDSPDGTDHRSLVPSPSATVVKPLSGSCVTLELYDDAAYQITLQAVNNRTSTAASAAAPSYLHIDEIDLIPTSPYVVAQYDAFTEELIISWIHDRSAQEYTVIWCLGKCKDTLQSSLLPGTSTSYTVPGDLGSYTPGDLGLSYGVSAVVDGRVSGIRAMSDCVYDANTAPGPVVMTSSDSDVTHIDLLLTSDCDHHVGKPEVYYIYWCLDKACRKAVLNVTDAHMNYTITSLEPGTAYTIKLHAANDRGVGPQTVHEVKTDTTKSGASWIILATALILGVIVVVIVLCIVRKRYCTLQKLDFDIPAVEMTAISGQRSTRDSKRPTPLDELRYIIDGETPENEIFLPYTGMGEADSGDSDNDSGVVHTPDSMSSIDNYSKLATVEMPFFKSADSASGKSHQQLQDSGYVTKHQQHSPCSISSDVTRVLRPLNDNFPSMSGSSRSNPVSPYCTVTCGVITAADNVGTAPHRSFTDDDIYLVNDFDSSGHKNQSAAPVLTDGSVTSDVFCCLKHAPIENYTSMAEASQNGNRQSAFTSSPTESCSNTVESKPPTDPASPTPDAYLANDAACNFAQLPMENYTTIVKDKQPIESYVTITKDNCFRQQPNIRQDQYKTVHGTSKQDVDQNENNLTGQMSKDSPEPESCKLAGRSGSVLNVDAMDYVSPAQMPYVTQDAINAMSFNDKLKHNENTCSDCIPITCDNFNSCSEHEQSTSSNINLTNTCMPPQSGMQGTEMQHSAADCDSASCYTVLQAVPAGHVSQQQHIDTRDTNSYAANTVSSLPGVDTLTQCCSEDRDESAANHNSTHATQQKLSTDNPSSSTKIFGTNTGQITPDSKLHNNSTDTSTNTSTESDASVSERSISPELNSMHQHQQHTTDYVTHTDGMYSLSEDTTSYLTVPQASACHGYVQKEDVVNL